MISVVIPARNEAENIGRCLDSLKLSAVRAGISDSLEIIVVLNRCTDQTEAIARAAGTRCVVEDAENLSIIRNAGVRATRHPYVITVDADSRVSKDMLGDVLKHLQTGQTVGGGVRIMPERWSLGILLTGIVLIAYVTARYRISSAGLFWFLKSDFDAIGGFNEEMLTIEDIDFGVRLKRHGRTTRRPFRTLWRSHIVTSCRKFDRFGDWFMFVHPLRTMRLMRGYNNVEEARSFFYRFKR